MAMAIIASMAIPSGDTKKAKRPPDDRWSWNCTADSVETSWRFVHVAEFEVVLLGWGVLGGTTIFTEYVEFELPTRVKFTPGDGIVLIAWKSPGIVKLVFDPLVCGMNESPLRLVR